MRDVEHGEVAAGNSGAAEPARQHHELDDSVLAQMHREYGNSHVMRVIASSLNVRSSPDTAGSGNILGTLPHGAEVTTNGEAGAWRSIVHPHGKAFVHGDYLSASAPPKQEDKHEKPDDKHEDKPPDKKPDIVPSGDFTGEQKYESRSITPEELEKALVEVAPSMSSALRMMMLGHAWGEQGGKNIINNNFAGMEGASAAYVVTWTSTVLSRSEVEGHPEKYKDWAAKGPPGCVTWQGRDAHTIAVQLERGEPQIACMVKKKRPAYASLAAAASAFVKNIESKLHKLQASSDPEHQELVAQAMSGDDDAYARIVTLSAPKLGIYPYNPGKEYPGLVKRHIAEARAHFAT